MMRNRRFSLLLLFVVGLTPAGCSQPSSAPGSGSAQVAGAELDPEQLRRREQQRVDYLVAGEYDRLAEMASPTLSYTHSNAALDSKEGFLRDLRSGRVVYRSMQHRDVAIRFVSPGVAVLNGLTDAVVTVDGQDQDVPLRFTIIYVLRDGEWLFEAWHSVRRPAA